ncbi:hypothetical protein WG66_013613 [Moniliophthora roreri]|uniref:Uncharacterized protein n=2 Tax=Moniliophthora roreri TaxID=221103 RepID=A0A0W0FAG6_MONRR|nr:hypothetical protein WG66_013613 [Moniliophthora roreri]
MPLPSSNAPPDSFSCLIPEILSDIFAYCSNETTILNGSDTPWTLTRVSRHWREVSLDTPAMWTFLSIDFDVISCSQTADHHSMLSFALKNTRDKPLHIYMYTKKYTPSPRIQPLLDLLHVHCARWSTLRLCVPNTVGRSFLRVIPLPKLYPLNIGAFSSLRELIIDGKDTSFSVNDWALFVLLTAAPLVRTVKISSVQCPQLGHRSPLLLRNQIAHLEVAGYTGSQIVDTISKSPRLETLVVKSYWKEWDSTVLQTMLLVTTILHWTISLECYRVPLPIYFPSRYPTNTPWTLSLERLFRNAPQTKSLILEGGFFGHIFDKIATDLLLPNLEHLVVKPSTTGVILLSPPLASILSAVESRVGPDTPSNVAKLKSLEVYAISTAHDVSLTYQLKSLCRYGLSTRVLRTRPSRFPHKWPFDPSMVTWISMALFPLIFMDPGDGTVRENLPIFDQMLQILERKQFKSKKELEPSGNLMYIRQLTSPSANIPQSVEQEYHIRERFARLYEKWSSLP